MPNHAQGVLKVRGTYNQLVNFLENGIDGKINFEKNEVYTDPTGVYHYERHLKRVNRGSIDLISGSFDNIIEDEKHTIFLKCSFLQSVDTQGLLELAREIGVDFKIRAFEHVEKFEQNIEIVDGNLILNDTIKYKDYKDWAWNCPYPLNY